MYTKQMKTSALGKGSIYSGGQEAEVGRRHVRVDFKIVMSIQCVVLCITSMLPPNFQQKYQKKHVYKCCMDEIWRYIWS